MVLNCEFHTRWKNVWLPRAPHIVLNDESHYFLSMLNRILISWEDPTKTCFHSQINLGKLTHPLEIYNAIESSMIQMAISLCSTQYIPKLYDHQILRMGSGGMVGGHSMELVFPQNTTHSLKCLLKLFSEKENISKHCYSLSQDSFTLIMLFFFKDVTTIICLCVSINCVCLLFSFSVCLSRS